MVQNCPKWSKTVQNSLKQLKTVQNIPKWSKTAQIGQKWSEIAQNGSKWSKMVWNGPKWSNFLLTLCMDVPFLCVWENSVGFTNFFKFPFVLLLLVLWSSRMAIWKIENVCAAEMNQERSFSIFLWSLIPKKSGDVHK